MIPDISSLQIVTMNLVRVGFVFSLSSPTGGEGRGEEVRSSLCTSLPTRRSRGEREARDAKLIFRFMEKIPGAHHPKSEIGDP